MTFQQVQTTITVASTLFGAATGAYTGYKLGGRRGAVLGGLIGALGGRFLGNRYGVDLVSRFYGGYAALMAMLFGGEKYLEGPGGRVAFSVLENMKNTPMVTLYSNINQELNAAKALSTTPVKELAMAAGRSGYTQYMFSIPQGVLIKLEDIGLLIVRNATEISDGVTGIEYRFFPGAMPYISQFTQEVKP